MVSTGGRPHGLEDPSPGPWMKWRTKARHARAIRFIESRCRAPKGYGAGKLLKLASFQKEWLEEVMRPGVHAAVESIPRGNGKSTFKSALGVWATFDPGESGDPQVPVIATTVGQARKAVYGPAVRMIQMEPELSSRSKLYTSISDARVVVPSTSGEMFCVAQDPDGLQGLDPSLGLVDEIGFMSVESWASLLLATGKRSDSLIVAIGTPGFDQESALWHVRQMSDPAVHYTEFAADPGCDIRDRAQWRKSNPAFVAGFKGEHAFRVALSLPEPLFRIFQLGQWEFGTQGWLGVDGLRVWQRLADPWEFAPAGRTWVAVDMSRSRDAAAVVAVQRRPDGRFHAKARVWYPRDAAGGIIDGAEVMAYLRDLDRRFMVVAGYDPRFFEERAEILGGDGLAMVEFPQSLERMTPACGETYEAIHDGRLSHDGDPEFQKHVLNAVLRLNERGFTLQKRTRESPNKIDAAVALCMAASLAFHDVGAPVDLGVHGGVWGWAAMLGLAVPAVAAAKEMFA